jgi:hypothetical protein
MQPKRRVLIGVLLALVTMPAVDAHALCAVQREAGSWRNADPATRSLTRAVLDFVCQDQIHNGEPYPPGPPWYVHVWGKCSPSDCDWGRVGAQRLSSGHVYAYYDQGFARRYVYARMSQYRPGQLWIYTWTDFSDPNRADYAVHNWFVRQ